MIVPAMCEVQAHLWVTAGETLQLKSLTSPSAIPGPGAPVQLCFADGDQAPGAGRWPTNVGSRIAGDVLHAADLTLRSAACGYQLNCESHSRQAPWAVPRNQYRHVRIQHESAPWASSAWAA